MNTPEKFVRIINRKKYDVSTATLLAGDDWWDGHNWERRGRNTWLYRTPHGAYFTVTLTRWQGEQDCLTPISEGEAIRLYEGPLSEHYTGYEEAFPNVKVEEA